jgi:hypothetical protein
MHDHRPTRLLAAVAALATATTIAACGVSSPSRSDTQANSNAASRSGPSTAPSSSTGGLSSASSSTLAFSRCMRANGVPNFPDLRHKGMLIEAAGQTLTVDGVSVNAPAFVAAKASCERYLPHEQASSTQAAQQRRRDLRFAKCMRSHGVPNFPDPRAAGSSGSNQVARLPAGIAQSPAFQTAAKACGGGPKGPIG